MLVIFKISIDGDDEEPPPQFDVHHDIGGILVTVIVALPVSLTLTHPVVVPIAIAVFIVVFVIFPKLQLYPVLAHTHKLPIVRLHHGAIVSVTCTPVSNSCPLFTTVIVY